MVITDISAERFVRYPFANIVDEFIWCYDGNTIWKLKETKYSKIMKEKYCFIVVRAVSIYVSNEEIYETLLKQHV